MALPALAGPILGIAGSVLSSRSQRRATERQNAYNEEAYLRQVEAERERDYQNQYGVYSRLQRPFEESTLTQMQRRMRLGGFTPEGRQISQDLLELQRQYDTLSTTLQRREGESTEDYSTRIAGPLGSIGLIQGSMPVTGTTNLSTAFDESDEEYAKRLEQAKLDLRDKINSKLQEKSDLEYNILSETSAQFDPMRQASQAAAMGIYDGSMLQDRLASMGIGQDLRSQLATTRGQYLPGVEAAQDALVDPARGEELRRLNLQRAQQMDDPATRALRLEAARDREFYDPLQQSRMDLAETNVAGISEAALTQAQKASMGRTYGGSSTVLNRTLAGLALQGNQQAAVAREAARQQNLMENQGLRERDYTAQAKNLSDLIRSQRLVNDANVQNEQQLAAARSLADQNTLNQIQNRQRLDERSLSEQMQSASETDAAKRAAQQLQLSNIGLPDQLFNAAIASKTAVEGAQQMLDRQREQAMAVSYMGRGGMAPVDAPVRQATVNNTLGTILSGFGNYEMQQGMQQAGFDNQMELLQQQGINQQALQNLRMGQGQQQQNWAPQQNTGFGTPGFQSNFNMSGGGNWMGGGGNWMGGGGGGPMFGGAGNNIGYQGLGGMGWGGMGGPRVTAQDVTNYMSDHPYFGDNKMGGGGGW